MSHFYGTVRGQSSGEATRRGSKNSGLRVAAASWQGAVYVYLFHDVPRRARPLEGQWTQQHPNPGLWRNRLA